MAEATAPAVDMLDTIGSNAGSIPKGTRRVAIYLTGSGGIAWTNADVATLVKNDPQLQVVVRIDQSNSLLLLPCYLVKDIEPGAATLPVSIVEAQKRKAVGLRTCFYYFRAEETAVRSAVTAAGLDSHVDFWLADWNFTREQAIAHLGQFGIVAVQYASPSSNPHTLVPGSNRTLAQANVDLSVTLASWPAPAPAPPPHKIPRPPKPHVKITAAGIGGALTAGLLAYLNSHGAHLTHLTGSEQSLVTLAAAALAGYFTPGPTVP